MTRYNFDGIENPIEDTKRQLCSESLASAAATKVGRLLKKKVDKRKATTCLMTPKAVRPSQLICVDVAFQ